MREKEKVVHTSVWNLVRKHSLCQWNLGCEKRVKAKMTGKFDRPQIKVDA